MDYFHSIPPVFLFSFQVLANSPFLSPPFFRQIEIWTILGVCAEVAPPSVAREIYILEVSKVSWPNVLFTLTFDPGIVRVTAPFLSFFDMQPVVNHGKRTLL